jgi:hypothetical protein
MTGPKPQPQASSTCAGWTILTLKELLEKRFDQLDKLREAEAKSLVLQAAEYERRLDALNGEAERIAKIHGQNATRGDLERIERENAELHRKQDGLLLTRPEYNAQHDALAGEFHGAVKLFQAEISGLKEWRAEQGGKASQTAVVGAYIIAIAGWLISPLIALAIERMTR